MDLRGLAFVGCRLLALYFVIEALTGAVGIFASMSVTGAWSPQRLLLAASAQLFPGVQLLVALLLWFGAGRLSGAIAAVESKGGRRRFGGEALSRVVLISAGLLVLSNGTDDVAVLSHLVWLRWVDGSAAPAWVLFIEPGVAAGLKLILGVTLLLGAGLQTLLAAAEREGIQVSPRRDLADASLFEMVGELASAAGSLGVRGVTDLAQRVVKSSVESMLSAVAQRQPDFAAISSSDGQVTIMFSDMEGFTAMTQRLGDAQAHKVIKVHNRIVREALSECQGQEVELQGDGFLLAFATSEQALRCAGLIQRRLAKHSSRHPHAPIRVRIGMHSGRPIKEGERFFGLTVIMAARIAAQAAGGETLVSAAVHADLKEQREFAFDTPVEAALKGLDGRHLMYPVLW